MIKAVIDASVLIAVLHGERGAERFESDISYAVVSSVNLAEVISRLVLDGVGAQAATSRARSIVDEVFDFNLEQATIAGALARITRSRGLSFGDRACLALGMVRDLPVYTADRVWSELEVGVTVQLMR